MIHLQVIIIKIMFVNQNVMENMLIHMKSAKQMKIYVVIHVLMNLLKVIKHALQMVLIAIITNINTLEMMKQHNVLTVVKDL